MLFFVESRHTSLWKILCCCHRGFIFSLCVVVKITKTLNYAVITRTSSSMSLRISSAAIVENTFHTYKDWFRIWPLCILSRRRQEKAKQIEVASYNFLNVREWKLLSYSCKTREIFKIFENCWASVIYFISTLLTVNISTIKSVQAVYKSEENETKQRASCCQRRPLINTQLKWGATSLTLSPWGRISNRHTSVRRLWEIITNATL
jgi:hypothetical protein